MKQKMGQVLNGHIEAHASLYLFTFVLFIMGVIFGTLTIQSLGYDQQNDLFYYFEQFLNEMHKEHFVDPGYAFYDNFFHYVKFIGFIWVLGLSIIGLPVILVMLFLKGVFIGFSVGFLVHQMSWHGFLLALVSVIPQNLFVVPLILMMGVLSISFSLKLIGHLFGSQRAYQRLSLSKYIAAMVVVVFALAFIAGFQTYLSPMFMKWVS